MFAGVVGLGKKALAGEKSGIDRVTWGLSMPEPLRSSKGGGLTETRISTNSANKNRLKISQCILSMSNYILY